MTPAPDMPSPPPFQPAAPSPQAPRVSWLWGELSGVRNVRPGFRWGLLPGLAHAALDQVLLRGKAWWTLHHRWPHRGRLPVKGKEYLALGCKKLRDRAPKA
ncbi:hypothetical protein QJQ45_008795 [Haematococcus lacustris]|nr:hypothetical protein QJQ45_008795 [Haematococcus lacustris]